LTDRGSGKPPRWSAPASTHSRAIHIEDLELGKDDPFHHEEPRQNRWLLTTCVAGVAGSLVIASALLGIFGDESTGNRTLASVNPADFWQQKPQIAMKGDYNGEVATATEITPLDDESAASDEESDIIIPARTKDSSYPSITSDALPYSSKTEVLESTIDGIDTENITIIAKTPPPEPVDELITLAGGESLTRRLIDLGVTSEAAKSLTAAIEPVFPGQLMKAGMSFDVTLDKQQDFYGNDVIFPVRLSFTPGPGEEIVVESDEDSQFTARVAGAGEGARSRYADYPYVRAKSKVGASLYATAKDQGIPDYIITEMIRIYSYDVDFQRQVKAGDEFEIFYGVPASGSSTKRKVLLYAALEVAGKIKRYYRYTVPGENVTDYFDENGQSATKGLLRTPVSGARLTSGFGMRNHPLLGYSKMHTGIDFGVPYGTPIRAAGNGTIEKSGRAGAYGNRVQIAHQGEYSTLYAHMSRIANGITVGARVRQGQVIGYVGSTGRSTGPHLHYEIRINDKPVNPLKVRVAGGKQLNNKALALFRQQQQKTIAMMKTAPEATQIAQNQ
jgi:murein DD-endopeptidase MepM/ murein hydrolase activator NlpD